MIKRKKEPKAQTMIYKTLHKRKLKIEQRPLIINSIKDLIQCKFAFTKMLELKLITYNTFYQFSPVSWNNSENAHTKCIPTEIKLQLQMFESKLEVKLFYYQGKNQKTNKEVDESSAFIKF